VNSEL